MNTLKRKILNGVVDQGDPGQVVFHTVGDRLHTTDQKFGIRPSIVIGLACEIGLTKCGYQNSNTADAINKRCVVRSNSIGRLSSIGAKVGVGEPKVCECLLIGKEINTDVGKEVDVVDNDSVDQPRTIVAKIQIDTGVHVLATNSGSCSTRGTNR